MTASGQASDLRLRVYSGVTLGLVALAATWAGGIAFAIVALVIGAVCLLEWQSMTGAGSDSRLHAAAAILYALIALALLTLPPVWALAAFAVAVAAAYVMAVNTQSTNWMPAGLAYCGAIAVSLALVRAHGHAGLTAIVFLFAVVWTTDIVAYFAGRAYGGPRLAPAISPGKTWSGAIGGLVGATVAGMLASGLTGFMTPATAGLLAVALSVVAQAGDLFESWIKRRFGVKDASHIIPGHGGMMDRVDGLATASVALFGFLALRGGFGNPAAAFMH